MQYCYCKGLTMLSISIYFYRGAGIGCSTHDVTNRLAILRKEMDQYDLIEKQLDAHVAHVQQSIRNITDDISNQQYSFLAGSHVF